MSIDVDGRMLVVLIIASLMQIGRRCHGPIGTKSRVVVVVAANH